MKKVLAALEHENDKHFRNITISMVTVILLLSICLITTRANLGKYAQKEQNMDNRVAEVQDKCENEREILTKESNNDNLKQLAKKENMKPVKTLNIRAK